MSVEHIQQATDVFRRFLKKKDLKVTRQREILLRRIFQREEHFTVESLEERVKGDGISRATIYRTLQLMRECGLVEEVEFGDERRHYEHVFGHRPHDHLVCVDCNKVFEVPAEDITELRKSIAQRLGFAPVGHSLRVEVRCEDLRRNGVCNRKAIKVL
ncbi:MAG: Fur family transcriptional regulator [Planctomycetota bacterium]